MSIFFGSLDLNILREAEDDAPTDYTQDDGGGGDSGDQGADPGGGEGNQEAPEDYTVPDDGNDNDNDTAEPASDNEPPEGGGDDADPPADGDDPDGDDPEGEDGDPPEDDGDMGGGSEEDEVKSLEKEIFDSLSDGQIAIKQKELKNRFLTMYDNLSQFIERLNDIPKSADIIKPLEFVSNKLDSTSQMLDDYINYTYDTLSYVENEINYNKFIGIIKGLDDILAKISSARDKR